MKKVNLTLELPEEASVASIGLNIDWQAILQQALQRLAPVLIQVITDVVNQSSPK